VPDVDMAVGVGKCGSDEDAMAHGGDVIHEIGGGATEGWDALGGGWATGDVRESERAGGGFSEFSEILRRWC
jgi:hypothetical protein